MYRLRTGVSGGGVICLSLRSGTVMAMSGRLVPIRRGGLGFGARCAGGWFLSVCVKIDVAGCGGHGWGWLPRSLRFDAGLPQLT